jgi:hypothetical protein
VRLIFKNSDITGKKLSARHVKTVKKRKLLPWKKLAASKRTSIIWNSSLSLQAEATLHFKDALKYSFSFFFFSFLSSQLNKDYCSLYFVLVDKKSIEEKKSKEDNFTSFSCPCEDMLCTSSFFILKSHKYAFFDSFLFIRYGEDKNCCLFASP